MNNLLAQQKLELYNSVTKLRQEGFSAKRIAKKLDISWHTVSHWLFEGCKPGEYDSGLSHPRTVDLTPCPELSYVLGVFWGDGYTSINDIGLQANDKEFVEEFANCLARVLGRKRAYGVCKRDSGRWAMLAGSLVLARFLRESLKSHKPIVESFPAQFLRGFFDSEGDVYECKFEGKNYYRQHVGVSNSNLSLLEYIHDLLFRKFSISSYIWRITRNKPRFIRGKLANFKKPVYSLRVVRRQDVVAFHSSVGFTIARKRWRLAQIIDRIYAEGLPRKCANCGRDAGRSGRQGK